MATEEQIRNYAHLLWEKAGRPEGRADEFWHAAEVELNAESESPDAPTEEGPTSSDQASKPTQHDISSLALFTDCTEYFYATLAVASMWWTWPLLLHSQNKVVR